ncbi:probable methyltransferase-like protein 24 [Mercenaria mercenaria]|uniref:probable methyltransferase-like protein 24 n=1 Tax=Mercenaria mercenaria TaxID=6596 RepID=UPI001E1D2E90|nr:probable methyltransferase-like protein 24 [Mercenaria mercenaria]
MFTEENESRKVMTRSCKTLANAAFGTLLLLSILLLLYVIGLLPMKPSWEDEKVKETVLPTIPELKQLSHRELAQLYHSYINQAQVLCRHIVRIGNLGDGGWEICEDQEFRPSPPCLVYSFGINDDFSFDDHMADRFNCMVHSFDPSMKNTSEGARRHKQWFYHTGLAEQTKTLRNGWKVSTLNDILVQQGHTKDKIDILKIDTEKFEWQTLIQIFESGGIENVKQLLIELHVAIVGEPERLEYIQGLGVLKMLYDHGFRIFYSHRNLWCKYLSQFEGIEEIGCHEVSFVYIPQ